MVVLHPVLDVVATIGVSLALLTAIKRASRKARNRLPYPPGPPGLPIIGNVHQLPQDFQEQKFSEWARQYGDIVFLRMFGTPAIVLNSVQVARELLEKRGAIYSERPPLTLLNNMMGWDCVVSHFCTGERFRKHRKWIQAGVQDKEVLRSYRHIQHREACTLLLGFVDTPEDFESHIKRYAAAIITEVAYGHRLTGIDDELLALADKATTETVRAGSPGSNPIGLLVEFFPILQHYPLWLPGSEFRIKTDEIRGHVRRMMDIPYNMVKEQLAAGEAVPCLTTNLLEDCIAHEALTESEEVDIKGVAAVLYAAGTDTSITVMASFLLAMTRYPNVFKKAQQEMDRVVGTDRLPDLDDYDSLPYLEFIFREVLRTTSPAPLGMPHALTKNDVYRGYAIPAGSMVIVNIWEMLHNPKMYPDPDRFWPERYEGLDKSQLDSTDPRNIVFGFGRRRCPGEQLTETNWYLMASYVIATMDVSRAKDDDGREIVPPGDFHSGFVKHPKPFKCAIRPRSEKAVNLVRQISAMT
ncbi:cytochrome P450 [Cytidiella melzeri]|nr:cytochrome P450 [Cytidiella melzeri]